MNAIARLYMLSVVVLSAGPVCGQAYPSKTVTLLVPTSSATAADITSRLLSGRLAQRLGQPVIVDNRTGASGTIGIGMVAKAAPDGHTVLVTPNTLGMIGWMQKGLTWDAVNDFAPVALLTASVLGAVVNASVPANSIGEFVALAKSRPGQFNYATSGVGTPQHLATELFRQVAGIEIVHIPHKTTAGAVTSLAGGEVQLGFFGVHAVLPLVKAGKLRFLATVGDSRSPWTAEVPTFREGGVALDYNGWFAAFLPRNTARDIVNRLSREMLVILALPDFQAELAKSGLVPNPGGPEELGALLKSDLAKWQKVIREGRIEAE